MEIKDNGYAENEPTGEIALATVGVMGESESGLQTAPTGLGKFKDVEALQKAYDCLQAEFTRRSQKLKQLEKEAENLKSNGEKKDAFAEKLRKNAQKARAEKDEFDGFVAHLEKANVRGLENAETGEENPLSLEMDESASGVNTATQNVESTATEQGLAEKGTDEGDTSQEKDTSVASERNEELSFEELYQKACSDERVRLKIIGEYLSSVGKTGAPLSRGGTGALAAPMKAKSVQEAGVMTLRFLKERTARL